MSVSVPKLRFRHQILILLSSIIIIVMVTVIGIAAPQLIENERRTAFERLSSQSNLKALWILREIEELERGLASLANDARLIDAVRFSHQLLPYVGSQSPLFIDIGEYNRGADPLDGTKLSLFWQTFDSMTPSFSYLESSFPGSQLYIVRPNDGLVSYTLHRDPLLASPLTASTSSLGGIWRCYSRALATPNKVVFEDFYTAAGANAKACAATVMRLNDQALAVVVQEFSVGLINEIMTTRAGLGDTGETYLVGEDKLLRTDSRPYGTGSSFDTFVDSRPVREGLAGYSGAADVLDYRGVPVSAVWQALTIDGIRWSLVAKFDRQEIYAQLSQNMARLFAAWFVLLVLLIVIAVWFANRIERPLRALLRNAQRIATGSYTGYIRETEGVREIIDLIRTFNKMATQIQDRTDALDKARQSAEQATLEAERATMAKTEFLSRMSHELRTPLNGVLGYAQLLRRDDAITDEQREVLQAIENCGQHLLELINDVLDLSRIESGNVDIELQPAHLRNLLQRVIDVVRPRADEKQLDFRIALPDTNRRVMIDATKVRQILINLLGNAVKFTRAGFIGLRVSVDDTNSMIICVVEDSGSGIETDQLNRIFQPFGQTSLGKEAGGAGLGLSITQQLCDAMGGQLYVDTRPNEGTTFTVAIPFQYHDAALSETDDTISLPSDKPQFAGLSALVVDDQATNRDILVKLLNNYGIDTYEASHGAQAVALWQQYKPSLVLMDLRMPVMDGFEASRQIRALQGNNSVAICAISASVQADTMARAKQAGCDEFLAKPLDVARLIDFISAHAAAINVPPSPSAKPAASHRGDLTAATAQAVRGQLEILSAHAMVGDVKAARQVLQSIEQLLGSSNDYVRSLRRMIEQFAMFEVVDYCIKIEAELVATSESAEG